MVISMVPQFRPPWINQLNIREPVAERLRASNSCLVTYVELSMNVEDVASFALERLVLLDLGPRLRRTI